MNENKATVLSVDQFAQLKAKRAIFLLGMFFFLTFTLGFLFYIPLWISAMAGVELGAIEPGSEDQFVARFELIIEILIASIAALIIFWMTRKTLPGQLNQGALASLGWKLTPKLVVLLGFSIGVLICAGFLFVLTPLLPAVEINELGPNATRASTIITGWQHFYWAVLLVFVVPPIEEFLFRGVLFTGLLNSFGLYVSGIAVSVLFVVAHAPDAIHYWPAWISLSLLAVSTIIVRIKTDSLAPAIAVHVGYNSVVVANHFLSHGHSF